MLVSKLSFLGNCLLLAFGFALPAHAWESQFFPFNAGAGQYLTQTVNVGGTNFTLPDHSYAGYKLSSVGLGDGIPCLGVTISAVVNEDISAKLNQAVTTVAAAGGGTVYIPAGTFQIGSRVTINADNIRIKGAGSSFTNLSIAASYPVPGSTYEAAIYFTGNTSNIAQWILQARCLTSTAVSADIPLGAMSVQAGNGSIFAVGDWVVVQQFFWPAFVAAASASTWPVPAFTLQSQREFSFTYVRKVTAIVGNQVSLDAPIPKALSNANASITLYKPNPIDYSENVGLEGVSIYTAPRALAEVTALMWKGVFNGWAHDVRIHNFNLHAFMPQWAARITMLNCIADTAQHKGGGGEGYGFHINASQNILVRQSSSTNTRHNMTTQKPMCSDVVFSRFDSSVATQQDDTHHSYAHNLLWDVFYQHNGVGISSTNRGTTSGNGFETQAGAVVWNHRGDGVTTGGWQAGRIQIRPDNYFPSNLGFVIGNWGGHRVYDNSTDINSSYVVGTEITTAGLQVGPRGNVAYEGVNTAGLQPESLFEAQLTNRQGGLPPDLAPAACGGTPTSTSTRTPTRTHSPSATATRTGSATNTPSLSVSATRTPSPSRTRTPSASPSATPTPTAASTHTLVGAIRWDAWVGAPNAVGAAVETSLGPLQYHCRLPFYGVEISPTQVQARCITQACADQEIAYAKWAGLDYWAFIWYPASSGLDVARNLYLSSANSNDVKFSLILEASQFYNITPAALAAYFQMPNYQKVLGNRPLFYLLGVNGATVKPEIDAIRSAAISAGVGTPYIVLMRTDGVLTHVTTLGLDALSMYATSWVGSGAPYATLASTDVSQWDYIRTSGYKMVPNVTTGWDKRPRDDNPVFWEADPGPNAWVQAPTLSELTGHVQTALDWVATYPATADANAVILYAWNEFDEGGWICPTLPGCGGTERVDALHCLLVDCPSPTPTSTRTPTAAASPTPTRTRTASPSPSFSPTASPSPTPAVGWSSEKQLDPFKTVSQIYSAFQPPAAGGGLVKVVDSSGGNFVEGGESMAVAYTFNALAGGYVELVRNYGTTTLDLSFDAYGLSVWAKGTVTADTVSLQLFEDLDMDGNPMESAEEVWTSPAQVMPGVWTKLVFPYSSFSALIGGGNSSLDLNRIGLWRIAVNNASGLAHSGQVWFDDLRQLSTNTATPNNNAVLSGSFIQLWNAGAGCNCGAWTQGQWDAELQKLKDLCQTTVFVQYGAWEDNAWYAPEGQSFLNFSNPTLGRIFTAAETVGMQVVVGLYFSESWNTDDKTLAATYSTPLSRHTAVAGEIAALFGASPAFGGWYIPQEVNDLEWPTGSAQVTLLRNFLRDTAAAAKAAKNAPVYLAPFFGPNRPADDLQAWWDATLGVATGIDVLIPQDGVGTTRTDGDVDVPHYLAAIRAAALARGRSFGVTVESFRQTDGWPINGSAFAAVPADINTLKSQLWEAQAAGATSLVQFEYPYMQGSRGAAFAQLYSDYQLYQQGAAPCGPTPTLTRTPTATASPSPASSPTVTPSATAFTCNSTNDPLDDSSAGATLSPFPGGVVGQCIGGADTADWFKHTSRFCDYLHITVNSCCGAMITVQGYDESLGFLGTWSGSTASLQYLYPGSPSYDLKTMYLRVTSNIPATYDLSFAGLDCKSPTHTPSRTRTSSPTASTTFTVTRSTTVSTTPTITVTASRSGTFSPSPSPTASPSGSPSSSVTQTVNGSFTSTATPSNSATGTFTVSASPSATTTVSASASPSATSSFTRSSTATPSSTRTVTLLGSATDTATMTMTPTETPLLSATNASNVGDGTLQILEALGVPNPDPNAIWVRLNGPADNVEVKIYSPGMTLLARLQSGPRVGGWSAVALPPDWVTSAPRGLFYVSCQATRGQQRSLPTKPIRLFRLQ